MGSGEMVAVNEEQGGRSVCRSTMVKTKALMDRLLNEKYDGNQSELAKGLGRSQPSISRIMAGGGIDFRTVIAVARTAGVDPRELLEDDLGPTLHETTSPYPNLDLAVKFAQADDPYRWPPCIVACVRSGIFGTHDVKPSVWLTRVDQLSERVRAVVAHILENETDAEKR